jgi:uracil-DNA glycosylase
MSFILSQNVRIHESWKPHLADEFESPYFCNLKSFLLEEKEKFNVFPPSSNIFAAFDNCHFDKTKVVILGQDPYHGQGQAHGLCFSVPDGVGFPPSLRNIFKELGSDIEMTFPRTGNLLPWAQQGVLLMNATLTVRENEAGSHQNKGWERFTDKVIQLLSEKKQNLVFMLWGNYARAKRTLIDQSKHLVLEAAHPSPLSAGRGFFGCKHFSVCNAYLNKQNIQIIDWRL